MLHKTAGKTKVILNTLICTVTDNIKLKEIDIKNSTYYNFGNIFKINYFSPGNNKVNKITYKYIFSYYVKYETKLIWWTKFS